MSKAISLSAYLSLELSLMYSQSLYMPIFQSLFPLTLIEIGVSSILDLPSIMEGLHSILRRFQSPSPCHACLLIEVGIDPSQFSLSEICFIGFIISYLFYWIFSYL